MQDQEAVAFAQIRKQETILVQLWILADRLLIPRLKNRVMRELSNLTKVPLTWPTLRKYHSSHLIPYIYDRTESGIPLRYLAMDMCLYDCSPQ